MRRRRVAQARAWGRRFLVAILAGCFVAGTAAIELGRTPAFDRLGELVAGTARSADVIAVLGEPQGHGKAQLTPEVAPMDVLFYEFSAMEGTKVREKMLIIFVDQASGTYQGYLWFAGGLMIGSKE